MKIAESNISIQAQHTYLEKHEVSEKLNMWVGNVRPNFEGDTRRFPGGMQQIPQDYILELSDQAKEVQTVRNNETKVQLSSEDKLKIQLIERFVKIVTGKKIKIKVLDKLALDAGKCEELKGKLCQAKNRQQQPPVQQKQGWGLEYDYHELSCEYEKMSFSAQGAIKTADGREINFSADLTMSREFMREQNISIRAGDARKVDPLVINFNGTLPQLTDTKFKFDLDSNRTNEQISFLRPGSGFLALDLNNDGRVNNGGELFGPNSGNGFAELAGYDRDNNGWIDENDPIFHQLRIWTTDEQGSTKLFALAEKGIGAIYLGNAETDFAMKDHANQLQGQVARTGVFLKEDGRAGTIQQIDLTV